MGQGHADRRARLGSIQMDLEHNIAETKGWKSVIAYPSINKQLVTGKCAFRPDSIAYIVNHGYLQRLNDVKAFLISTSSHPVAADSIYQQPPRMASLRNQAHCNVTSGLLESSSSGLS